jgi:hypothetical protein
MTIENGILQHFHCANCFHSGQKDKITVGWTKKGIQVWCDKCEKNVIALDFKGNKVEKDMTPKED